MIKFGTDGWRAVISEEFTFENVRAVAQAIADYIIGAGKTGGPHRVVVGYDVRFLSCEYAEAVSEVMAGNGIYVDLSTRASSTPAVSLWTRDKGFSGGIIITASHNPAQFNGMKFKMPFGGAAGPEVTAQIEGNLNKNVPKRMPFEEALKKGMIKKVDIVPYHLNYIRRYLDLPLLRKSRIRLLVDVMHGVGDNWADWVLKNTGIRLTHIHSEPDPLFGGVNPEPISGNLQEFLGQMRTHKFNLGIAIDGDADRIGAAAPGGEFITAHKIMALILLHFIEDKLWRGAVVKTIAGTSLIDKIAQRYSLKIYETPVGFKHICDLMLKEDILLGGEESGGIGFKDYLPERDGLLAGLLLLEMMAHRNKSIKEIMRQVERDYGRFCYDRADVHYEAGAALISNINEHPFKEILKIPVKEMKSYDGIKFILQDGSWLLFRLSGTEPILRIYAESHSASRARSLVKFGKSLCRS